MATSALHAQYRTAGAPAPAVFCAVQLRVGQREQSGAIRIASLPGTA